MVVILSAAAAVAAAVVVTTDASKIAPMVVLGILGGCRCKIKYETAAVNIRRIWSLAAAGWWRVQ